jgi:hypothetical protein
MSPLAGRDEGASVSSPGTNSRSTFNPLVDAFHVSRTVLPTQQEIDMSKQAAVKTPGKCASFHARWNEAGDCHPHQ